VGWGAVGWTGGEGFVGEWVVGYPTSKNPTSNRVSDIEIPVAFCDIAVWQLGIQRAFGFGKLVNIQLGSL
jgi:hypothetical protein